jgi:hypothetical protein
MYVAACVFPIDDKELPVYQRKAGLEAAHQGLYNGLMTARRQFEVLDVYCRRCGSRPGQKEWCPLRLSPGEALF